MSKEASDTHNRHSMFGILAFITKLCPKDLRRSGCAWGTSSVKHCFEHTRTRRQYTGSDHEPKFPPRSTQGDVAGIWYTCTFILAEKHIQSLSPRHRKRLLNPQTQWPRQEALPENRWLRSSNVIIKVQRDPNQSQHLADLTFVLQFTPCYCIRMLNVSS